MTSYKNNVLLRIERSAVNLELLVIIYLNSVFVIKINTQAK